MSVSAHYNLQLKTVVTDDDDNRRTEQGWPTVGQLSGSSTPAITHSDSVKVTLAAGAGSIDLRAFGNESIDMNGKRVRGMKLSCPSTNTANVTVTPGASSGYNVFGRADGKMDVGPDDDVFCLPKGGSWEAVAAGSKTIDFASTDLDAVIEVHIMAG